MPALIRVFPPVLKAQYFFPSVSRTTSPRIARFSTSLHEGVRHTFGTSRFLPQTAGQREAYFDTAPPPESWIPPLVGIMIRTFRLNCAPYTGFFCFDLLTLFQCPLTVTSDDNKTTKWSKSPPSEGILPSPFCPNPEFLPACPL